MSKSQPNLSKDSKTKDAARGIIIHCGNGDPEEYAATLREAICTVLLLLYERRELSLGEKGTHAISNLTLLLMYLDQPLIYDLNKDSGIIKDNASGRVVGKNPSEK